jgi:hypothetical protein
MRLPPHPHVGNRRWRRASQEPTLVLQGKTGWVARAPARQSRDGRSQTRIAERTERACGHRTGGRVPAEYRLTIAEPDTSFARFRLLGIERPAVRVAPMLVIGRPISRSLERTFSTGRCRQFCAHLGRSARRPCFSRAVVQGCGANCLSWVDLRRSAFERKHVEAGHSSRGLIFPIFSRCRIGDSLFKIGHV